MIHYQYNQLSNLYIWSSPTSGNLLRLNGPLFLCNSLSPTQVNAVLKPIKLGTNGCALINEDGSIWSVGNNPGNNTTVSINYNYTKLISTYSWIQIDSAPDDGSILRADIIAIRSDGLIYQWGDDNASNYALAGTSSPVQCGSGMGSFIQIDACTASNGLKRWAAIRSDGALFIWGRDVNGNFGAGGSAPTRNSLSTQLGTSSWSQIKFSDGGFNSVIALTSDSLLFTWGSGSGGELGDGTTITKSSPVQIGTSSWVYIAKGGDMGAAIRVDGGLFTWGVNTFGQLGDGTTIAKSSPVQVGASSWSQVAIGNSSVFALTTDNRLFAFGVVYTAELGNSSTFIAYSSPVQIGSKSWSQISSSKFVDMDGYVFSNSELPLIGKLPYSIQPIKPFRSPYNINTISGSTNTLGIIDSRKRLLMWGTNSTYGQLGDGTTTNNYTSEVTYIIGDSWNQIKCGYFQTIGINSSGLLFSWGRNTEAQLGDGTLVSKSSPVQIGSSSWIYCSSGVSASAAIRSDGALFTWGNGVLLGNGDTNLVAKSSPVQIGTSSWVQVEVGNYHMSAIDINGFLYSWGAMTSGSLGNNMDSVDVTPPTSIGISATKISIGGFPGSLGVQICAAIRSDGGLITWGRGNEGALGDGTTTTRSSPVQIGTDSWTQVSCGSSFMAAIRSDGGLFTWGNNTQGQLGNGNTTTSSSPAQIGTSSWVTVACGGSHALAIRSDGGLFGWGNNTGGTIGNTSLISRSSPVQVGTSSWAQIAAGSSHSVGLTIDGGLYCWGVGTNGRLGNGAVSTRSSPVHIGTSSWSQLYIGQNTSSTAAIRIDGGLFVWGQNNPHGALGISSIIDKSSPVQVGTSSWSQISMGSTDSIGLDINKNMFTWGSSPLVLLADGSVTARSSPVQVGTSSWIFIDIAANNAAAIDINNVLYTWGKAVGGALGNNLPTSTVVSSPIQIGSLSWKSVHVAALGLTTAEKTFAIRSDDLLFAWGVNTNGELGDGTTITKSSPVQIGSSSWLYVNCIGSKTVAININRNLFLWGTGYQITDMINNSSSPIQFTQNKFRQALATGVALK